MINKAGHFILGKWFLLFVSVWFYGYAGIKCLLIVILLALINYLIYRFLLNNKRKKVFMVLGIIFNITFLIYSKYTIPMEITVNKYMGTHFSFISILVPLGISFITFSQISFLADNYREYDEVSILDYLLYVLFFPKVTVGPIALSKEFIPQFNDALRKTVNWDNIAKGLLVFSIGIAKKVLLADSLAKYADWGFMHIEGLGTTNAFIVMLAYTLQIYFDFSGFCNMANGICLMLNIDLPRNFYSPYRSKSVGEFWDRWHITLTKFFTKYVYIPLGGNRKGNARTYLNIMIVFIISGIWHGAAVTFLIWGLLHGIMSCIERLAKKYIEMIPDFIKWCITFLFVNIAWVFFRAQTIDDAVAFIGELFSFKLLPVKVELIAAATLKEYELFQWIFAEFTKLNTYYTGLIPILLFLLFALFASIRMRNVYDTISDFKPNGIMVAGTVFLLIMSIISLSDISSFIYVNF